MRTLYLFSEPDAHGVLTHDTAHWTIFSQPGVIDGRLALAFSFDETQTSNGHGSHLVLLLPSGRVITDLRSVLLYRVTGQPFPRHDRDAVLLADDFRAVPLPPPIPCPEPPPPDPPPPPTDDPVEIVRRAQEAYPLHEQRVDMLKKAARDLNAAGISSGSSSGVSRGPFGILRKQSGNNCDGYSCDIIAAGQGVDQGQWDVLINDTTPAFNGPKTIADNIRVDICEPQV